MSTCYLEVHIAEEVLQTLDIGQEYEIVVAVTGHQTAGNARDLLFDRYACCHQGHAGSAGGCHGSGTVGLESLGDRADGIREFLDGRQYGKQGPLRQGAVADLTTAGTSGYPGLTYGIAGEVVLMYISLLCDVGVKALHTLCLGKGRQCDYVADLGLASCEHGGTMDTGNDVDFRCQGTDLVQLTAVRSLMVLEDHLADGLLLILINSLAQDSQPLFVVRECFFQLLGNGFDVAFSGLLVICKYGCFHLFRRNDLFDRREKLFRNRAGNILSMICLLTASAS